jgi:fatty-acyl-CoA synthase
MSDLHQPHWPLGVPQRLAVPNESLWQIFDRQAQKSPDGVGLNFLGRDFTWQALSDEAQALAGGLQAQGVQQGDRVILFTQNCPQYVMAFFALCRIGAVIIPVNPMNKAAELEHYLLDSGAKLAIASADIAHELVQAAEAVKAPLVTLVRFDIKDSIPTDWNPLAQVPDLWKKWLSTVAPDMASEHVTVKTWRELVQQKRVPTDVAVAGTDLVLMPYTSGTTGAAKGCLHTHSSLLHNATAGGHWLDLREGDSQLIAVPLFHITGLVMGMLACVKNACRIDLMPRWDRRVAAHTIAHQRVTHWPNIPTMVIDLLSGEDLAEFDLSSLRYVGGGGAPMPDAVAKKLEESYGLKYIEGYGLTETAAPTHCNPMPEPKRHCLGIPFVSVEARIIHPDTLETLGVDEVGEIVVRGPQLFQGYWNQPKATAEAFIELDGQRFFRTGDIGRFDQEGYFFMADRLKRMINASGFKVWPAEVEALLHRHPSVKESCVISTKDPYRGESVKALVVLHKSHEGKVSENDLIDWAKAHMAAYKYPREVEFVSELPRTATGKVLWRKAQADQDARDAATRTTKLAANQS